MILYEKSTPIKITSILIFGILLLLSSLPSQAQSLAYIPDYNGTTSVIDVATNLEVDNLPWTAGDVRFHPDGQTFYTIGPQDLFVYDAATTALIATIPVGNQATEIAVSAVTNRIYVANHNSGQPGSITVIDLLNYTVVDTINVNCAPDYVVVSADGAKAYVTCGDGIISVIDTATNTIVNNITLNTGRITSFTYQIVAHPTENFLYASSNGPYIHVIDTTTDTVISQVSIPSIAYYLDVTPDNSKVYATVSKYVYVVDTQSNTLLTTIDTGIQDSMAIKIRPTGSAVYVAGYSFGASGPITQAVVIDITTDTVSTIIDNLGFMPRGSIAFSPLPEDVAGSVTGLRQSTVICSNLTTSQQVTIPLQGVASWNCEAEGLLVNSGDQIQMNVTGTAK